MAVYPSAHGQSFHASIWHMSLSGITDKAYLERIQFNYDEVGFILVLKEYTFMLSSTVRLPRCARSLSIFANVVSSHLISPCSLDPVSG